MFHFWGVPEGLSFFQLQPRMFLELPYTLNGMRVFKGLRVFDLPSSDCFVLSCVFHMKEDPTRVNNSEAFAGCKADVFKFSLSLGHGWTGYCQFIFISPEA